MNQQRWNDAAERFRKTRAVKKAQEEQRAAAKTQAAQQAKEQQERYATDVQTATKELSQFLLSEEGQAAQRLLAASERHIVVTEENEGGGCGIVYFLDGNGLQQSVEAMGMWMAHATSEDIPEPKISSTNPKEVVRLAIRQGARPHQIVEKIRQDLDCIAAEVL